MRGGSGELVKRGARKVALNQLVAHDNRAGRCGVENLQYLLEAFQIGGLEQAVMNDQIAVDRFCHGGYSLCGELHVSLDSVLIQIPGLFDRVLRQCGPCEARCGTCAASLGLPAATCARRSKQHRVLFADRLDQIFDRRGFAVLPSMISPSSVNTRVTRVRIPAPCESYSAIPRSPAIRN